MKQRCQRTMTKSHTLYVTGCTPTMDHGYHHLFEVDFEARKLSATPGNAVILVADFAQLGASGHLVRP
eukprot:2967038-Pleurochrysis_carterae.AAC.1